MRIEEYETPAIADEYAPRPKASQIAAAAHRAGDTEPLTPIAPAPASRLPLAIGAVVLVLAMLAMATWQLSRPMQPMAIQPAAVPIAAPTSAPAPTAAPTSAPAPTAAPTSAPAPTTAQAEPPAGRGLASPPAPTDPPPADPSNQYIANVGAQAPHSPRGGLCGPTGGDCAPGVPAGLDNSVYIANVGAQAPHKVR
jgi:hypothetical protein